MSYQLLKLIHILSATLMIGTGLGSAFYLFFTYKKAKASTVKDVLSLVVIADSIFTLPSVIVQLITGIFLSNLMSLLYTKWFWIVIIASVVVLFLWLIAVVIQYKLKRLLEEKEEITAQFHGLMKQWYYLGIFSFSGSIFLYYLMVYKPFL